MSEALPAWDSEVLARIGFLQLRARQLVNGYLHGTHASTRITSSVEFADYKEYSPGDPLRDLDWRIQARTDRLVVRRHQAERELALTLVIDASASAGLGDGGRYPRRPPLEGSKWGYAAVLAATLALWMFRRGEPVGLAILGGSDVRWPWLPPRGGSHHLTRLIGALAETRPSGSADLAGGLARVGALLPRRSLVVLLSELDEEPDAWGPMLSALVARKVDLRVLQLADSRELGLSYSEALRFRSPEGGDPVVLDPGDVREEFTAVRDAWLAEVQRWVGGWKGHHVMGYTDQPMDQALAALIAGAR